MDILDRFELTLNRNLLKSAIMGHRTFTCEYSGLGLDVRRSVLIMFSHPEHGATSKVVDGSIWDDRKDVLVEMTEHGFTVEVLDGRCLSSRSVAKQAQGVQVYKPSTDDQMVCDAQESMF